MYKTIVFHPTDDARPCPVGDVVVSEDQRGREIGTEENQSTLDKLGIAAE
jgi:hypothetical protein